MAGIGWVDFRSTHSRSQKGSRRTTVGWSWIQTWLKSRPGLCSSRDRLVVVAGCGWPEDLWPAAASTEIERPAIFSDYLL